MAALNLQIGECVHYGAHGVCRVCGRESKAFGGGQREYYALQPTGSESILLYLPVDAEPVKVHLRRLLSRQEIMNLLKGQGETGSWITDSKVRREAWNRVLRGGDTAELIGMVRTLHAHSRELPEGKQLPMSDQEMMQAAQRQLYGEFSYVLELSQEQVLPLILGEPEKTAQAGA